MWFQLFIPTQRHVADLFLKILRLFGNKFTKGSIVKLQKLLRKLKHDLKTGNSISLKPPIAIMLV